MVEAHVAGLAGLRLPRLFDREGMAGMAGIAGGHAESGAALSQILDLRLGLQSDLVASAAALHPFHQSHRLPVGGRHGLHGRPGQGMLAALNCFTLFS